MRLSLFLAGHCLGIGIGFYCGTMQTHIYRRQIEHLTNLLTSARKVSATCHMIVADHWSTNHLVVPGSKEIASTSKSIASSLGEE